MRILAILVCLLLVRPVFAVETDPGSAYDKAYQKRRIEANARFALEGWRRLSEKEPTNKEWWWRRAMACQFVGYRLQKGPSRAAYFDEGQMAGKKAVALDPKCAPCLFWQAINMALYGEESGIVRMIFTLGPIQDLLHRSAKQDPSYAFGGAYRILGAIYEKVPPLLGGSDSQAREFYHKAIAQVPDNPLNYWMLARHWADEMEDPKKAIEVIDQALKLPRPPEDEIESFEAVDELKALRVQLLSRQT